MSEWLKSLLPRDLRAFIALWASVLGTMALTAGVAGIVVILWLGGWPIGTENARIDKIGQIAILLTIIMGVTMTSLGLAINRRSVKGNVLGASFEATGGDDDTPPTPPGNATTVNVNPAPVAPIPPIAQDAGQGVKP